MGWFSKHVELSEDFVELSIGRVYYKPLLNYVIRLAENTYSGVWSAYFTIVEINILNMKQSLYETLSVLDGQKIRVKTIEILKRHGITEPEPQTIDDEWSITDKQTFREQQDLAANKIASALRNQ